MEPLDEEDFYDRHVYNDNPGADDLEEEPNNELATAMMEAQAKKDNEAEVAALIDWADCVSSYQESKHK